ncbi:unnamed protein product [Leptidea sinapis]|uniref:Uncharacterized protein n=1 Tax=Leptidea sinapis TaxID=189913 RepID=A0A5E4QPI8_9NEOP|nr:unnamed protein product [Leptidea sinapis]
MSYRRISSSPYSPMLKYGPPRLNYRFSKPSRSIPKKYKKDLPSKFKSSHYKKRQTNTKPWQFLSKPSNYKPTYYVPPKLKKNYNEPFFPEPIGFEKLYDYSHKAKESFGEPPLDLYGIPLKTTNDAHLSHELLNPSAFDADTLGMEFKKYQIHSDFDFDKKHAFLKKRPTYTEQYDEPTPSDEKPASIKKWPTYAQTGQYDELTASNKKHASVKKRPIYKQTEQYDKPTAPNEEDNIEEYYPSSYKYTERQIDDDIYDEIKQKPYHIDKKTRIVEISTEEPDEVLVGGQYAEPPGRIVHKFISNDAAYPDDDNTKPDDYIDPDIAISATISPYVNYKNSNMAFSPQNLNDAFSIVYK